MEEIAKKIQSIAAEVFDADIKVDVTVAPEGQKVDGRQAEFASNVAMKLAGILKMNPREAAEQIMSELRADNEFSFDVEIAGPGFLNFIARDEYWKQNLANLAADFDKNISSDEYSGKTVICEFSDPNPFKVLHVGHLYTSIVGDAMSRLVEFAGGKVVRANFGGDVGLHVAKTLYAVMRDNADTKDIETIAAKYVEGTRAYEDDEAAKAEITKLNKLIYEIAEAGEEKDWNEDPEKKKVAELYWQGRKVSYQYFEDFYKKVGVKFDKYYPESTVAVRGLKEVKEHVGKVYEESNGAIIFPGEKYDLHTRVFINAEGLPTYEAKDVGLIFTKWDDYKFDESIVITGNDIIDYMKVVLKSISLYAPELVERTKHITHGNVRLPGNEKMSSRKGNFIKAIDVLNEVSELVSKSSKDEKTAEMVSMAAIKYAFLKYKIGGNIEFDAKESVSTTGNSGVYLQYSAVRARKILAAASSSLADALLAQRTSSTPRSATPASSNKPAASTSWSLNEHEKKLIRKLAQYKYILNEAAHDLTPHKLANYLFEAAQEFSRFYENVKVAGSEFETERAEIVKAYLNVMTHGLKLLGIEVPEAM
ncbi:arginine--tRNA ligase [Candidatus Saccharibacteria bacterium]|nr:arginine--tRNA ligase [Candidatus Saccharibacteria bacterium]